MPTTNDFTPEELEKLPKWAQSKIYDLRNELETTKAKLTDERAIASADNPETRVQVAYRTMSGLRTLFLDDHETVEFLLATRDLRVSMNRDFSAVRVEADGPVSIRPGASNCFTVTVEE